MSAATFKASVQADCRRWLAVQVSLFWCTAVGGFSVHGIHDCSSSPQWDGSYVEVAFVANHEGELASFVVSAVAHAGST